MKSITDFLLLNKEEKYGDFTSKLIPEMPREKIIGVRMPVIRKYASELVKTGEYKEFVSCAKHDFHEENLLHVSILSVLKDYNEVLSLTEAFLPYIDNWAVCDSFKPKCFKKNLNKLYPEIMKWLESDLIYTKRFAVDMLMDYYLDEAFSSEHLSLVLKAQGEGYYLKMVIAWYYATALAKQYSEAVRILEDNKLEKWTHNKTIQKACESYRIDDETKAYLKTLKIK